MYLVDTSVWIDFLREKNNSATQSLIDILDNKIPFAITSLIYQEILQGAKTQKDFAELVAYFGSQRFCFPKDNLFTYQSAARLYYDCRKAGITIRSSVDCMIVQLAIEHNLTLLHNDKDFVFISKYASDLKLV